MKKLKNESLKFCIWGKIKILLTKCEIKKTDKYVYKEKLGLKLIENNKLLVQEFKMWCEIFNNYKEKLSLFYSYSKSYKYIYDEINLILIEINKKLQMETETFNNKIVKLIYKYTSSDDFKEILEIINSEMFQREYYYKDIKIFNLDVDLNERNVFNTDLIVNIIKSENIFFENEINKIKEILDKMTDLCENSAILNINILKKLKIYLEGHQNFLIKNINDL